MLLFFIHQLRHSAAKGALTIWNINLSSILLPGESSKVRQSQTSSVFFKSKGGTQGLSNCQVIQEVCGKAGTCWDLASLSLVSLTNAQPFLSANTVGLIYYTCVSGLIRHHKSLSFHSHLYCVSKALQNRLKFSIQFALSAPKETFPKDWRTTTYLNTAALLRIKRGA